MNYKTMEKLNNEEFHRCLFVLSQKDDDPTVLTFSAGHQHAFLCKFNYFIGRSYLLIELDYVTRWAVVHKCGQYQNSFKF